MTNYLQSWVESSKGLPAELVRCFKLMQELDKRSISLQQAINTSAEQQIQATKQKWGNVAELKSNSSSKADAATLDERMQNDMAEVLRIADEKINLAHQIYDFVDRNICQLDKDLKSFDAELNVEGSRLGIVNEDGVAPDAKRRKVGRGTAKQGVQELVPQVPQVVAEADPNEPTYCYCNRVSFGEMIGCDNPDCAIEWFHFECVGIPLDGRPKGKWYCKDCTALKKVGKVS